MQKICRSRVWVRWRCWKNPSCEESPVLHGDLHKCMGTAAGLAAHKCKEATVLSSPTSGCVMSYLLRHHFFILGRNPTPLISKNKSSHFSPLWCTKAGNAQTQGWAQSMWEGPWDDIGACYLKQSVYSCVQARHCIEYYLAGASTLQSNQYAHSGGCGAAGPTTSVNGRRKGSISIPNSGLSWPIIFLPQHKP